MIDRPPMRYPRILDELDELDRQQRSERKARVRTEIILLVLGALVAALVISIAAIGRARAEAYDARPLLTMTVQPVTRSASVPTISLRCLPASIRAALARVDQACGIKIISTHRPGAMIAGTKHPSMHATCRAADFTSRDYACVYRELADWPGKLSTDAGRIGHVHIDDGRYARFSHARARQQIAGAR
jgi:hypothetical protein